MAVFEQKKVDRVTLDDRIPLLCTIESSQNLRDHTEYNIRVQRGPVPENHWTVTKRYSDFVLLDAALKISGIELTLPPKKVFGNMEREFIAERQTGLQNYMKEVMSHPYLANSFIVKRFLDSNHYETNLREVALQNISMFFRSEPKWEVIEPIPDVGTRIRKQYFIIKDKAEPKSKFLLSWCKFGPDKYLADKDLVNIMKLLPTFQHPSLFAVSFAMANETSCIAIRQFCTEGSLRDIICKAKPKQHFLKKYASPKLCAICQLPAIKVMGRQVLEILKFLYDKGLPYGHLHAGNVIVQDNRIKLLEIENFLLGVPAYYRSHFTQIRKINTVEDIDVYSFGHLIYEMTTGYPLKTAHCDVYPPSIPLELQSIFELTLSSEAAKIGLPSIADLLNHQLFRDVVLPATEKPQFKIPSKLKEALKEAKIAFENRLKEEKKVIKQFKRLSKAQAFHNSEEEKQKRRRSKKKQLSTDGDISINGTTSPVSTGTASPTPVASPPPTAPPPPPAAPPATKTPES